MPDLKIKSLQTALQCHEDYTRKQIDAHRQSSAHTRKLDLRRDVEPRCRIRGRWGEVEHSTGTGTGSGFPETGGPEGVQCARVRYLAWRSSWLLLTCPFQLQNHYFHSPGHCHYHCHRCQSTHTFWVPCPRWVTWDCYNHSCKSKWGRISCEDGKQLIFGCRVPRTPFPCPTPELLCFVHLLTSRKACAVCPVTRAAEMGHENEAIGQTLPLSQAEAVPHRIPALHFLHFSMGSYFPQVLFMSCCFKMNDLFNWSHHWLLSIRENEKNQPW